MTINKKQICLLLFCIIPATKFMILPAFYSSMAKQDVWFASAVNFLLDGGLLAVTLLIIKKFEGKTFYEILQSNLGNAAAKIIFFTYFLMFTVKAVVPLIEHKNFVEISLYETAPSLLTFLPFFPVAMYACAKGLNTMARTSEILFWLTLTGLFLVIFLSVGAADPFYLQPVLKNPIKQTLSASFAGILWYGQPIFLLFCAGKIKIEKRFYLSISLTFAITALICMAIFAIFTAIYGDVAVRQLYSIAKMSKYAIALSNVGRFDYVALILLVAVNVLALAVPMILATECFGQVFGKKRIWLNATIETAISFFAVVIGNMYFNTLLNSFTKYLIPFIAVMLYLLPLLILLFGRNKKSRAIS